MPETARWFRVHRRVGHHDSYTSSFRTESVMLRDPICCSFVMRDTLCNIRVKSSMVLVPTLRHNGPRLSMTWMVTPKTSRKRNWGRFILAVRGGRTSLIGTTSGISQFRDLGLLRNGQYVQRDSILECECTWIDNAQAACLEICRNYDCCGNKLLSLGKL